MQAAFDKGAAGFQPIGLNLYETEFEGRRIAFADPRLDNARGLRINRREADGYLQFPDGRKGFDISQANFKSQLPFTLRQSGFAGGNLERCQSDACGSPAAGLDGQRKAYAGLAPENWPVVCSKSIVGLALSLDCVRRARLRSISRRAAAISLFRRRARRIKSSEDMP